MNKTSYIDYANYINLNYIKYANFIIYTNYVNNVNYITSWINYTDYMQGIWVDSSEVWVGLWDCVSWTSTAQEEPPSCWNLEGRSLRKHTEERGGGSVECISDVTAAGGSMLSDDIILLTQAPPTRHQACRKSRWGTSEQKQRRTVPIPRFDISLSNITTITRLRECLWGHIDLWGLM